LFGSVFNVANYIRVLFNVGIKSMVQACLTEHTLISSSDDEMDVKPGIVLYCTNINRVLFSVSSIIKSKLEYEFV